jgi:hypothetical protein
VSARFAIEALAKAPQCKTFSCGNERIDRYFHETVTQDIKHRYVTCFGARDLEAGHWRNWSSMEASRRFSKETRV